MTRDEIIFCVVWACITLVLLAIVTALYFFGAPGFWWCGPSFLHVLPLILGMYSIPLAVVGFALTHAWTEISNDC